MPQARTTDVPTAHPTGQGPTAVYSCRKLTIVSMPVVLIVDDEPGLLKLFVGLVKRLGCEAVPALSGEEALEILEQFTPDLLILDLAMPEISGADVLRYVRSQPSLDPMKVMILTARPGMVPEVEELGVDCWVTKPVMPNDFLATVNDILSNSD